MNINKDSSLMRMLWSITDSIEELTNIRDNLSKEISIFHEQLSPTPIEKILPLPIDCIKIGKENQTFGDDIYLEICLDIPTDDYRLQDVKNLIREKYKMSSKDINYEEVLYVLIDINDPKSKEEFEEFLEYIVTHSESIYKENIAHSERNINRQTATVQFLSSMGILNEDNKSIEEIKYNTTKIFPIFEKSSTRERVSELLETYNIESAKIKTKYEEKEFKKWLNKKQKMST